MIRVLLAEDQAMVRGALASLLELEPDIEVVAQVSRGDEVAARPRRRAPTSRCSTSRCPAPPAWTRSSSCAASCPNPDPDRISGRNGPFECGCKQRRKSRLHATVIILKNILRNISEFPEG